MKFLETKLKGAFIIEPELLRDDRGFFARTWCRREAEAVGLSTDWVQCNVSFNRVKGTLRGMHYQAAPWEEIKLVRCSRGAIYDVIIDLRPQSATCKQWVGVELTADNCRMVYVPKGFAHGFLTLQDESEVFYQMSQFYSAEHARGVRWDDPAFGIKWPIGVSVLTERDRSYADFTD
ncbi:MAG: dTDP-4-dehydrorhamnose 3,5-epimerase [Chloroflexota bacterium]